MFGAASLLTVVVCATEMPETKGKTLEEIDKAFEDGDEEQQQNSVRMRAVRLLRKWQRGHLGQRKAPVENHEM